jgi:anaerobic magnesium-protoporphyrin IX monomethyl ester cyclase
MRVLFASAVDTTSEGETRYRPLWPASLAAYVKRELGPDTVQMRYATRSFEQELRDYQPDLLALSSVTQNYGMAIRHARLAKATGIPVIIGGMHISSLPESLSDAMDVACIGEGEQTFTDLLHLHLETGGLPRQRLGGIPGLAFREEGALRLTAERANIPSIDDLPHPDRSLIGYTEREYVYTARGCAYRCVFCACTKHWKRVRYASAPYVIDEIRELVDHGVRTIRFNDDNFVANKSRLSEISSLVTEAGIHRRARFSCWARSNDITPEVVRDLKDMNVVAVVLGLESGSDRVLRYLKGGGVTVEDNRRAVDLLKDARIQTSADFIIGSPEETEEEIEKTYQFIRKSRIDFVAVNVFSPLPGTPVWELAEKRGLVSTDMDWERCDFKFNPNDRTAIMLSDTVTHEQLSRWHQRFARLTKWRYLRALPHSPWLDEIPKVLVKMVRGKMRRIAARVRGARGTA